MDNYLLALMQLCDSNLPTGAFSHSYGLETYIQEGQVVNKQTFAEWLNIYIREQLVYTDGLACRLVYEALEADRNDDIWRLDRILMAQSLSREAREAAQRMGERMLKLVLSLYEAPVLAEYGRRVGARFCVGHPAIVFPLIAHHLGIPRSQAIVSYLFSTATSLVQNGVRGIPLGQTEGQQLIRDMQAAIWQAQEIIDSLDPEELGAVTPGIEVSQMRHERLHVRLFMS